MAGKNSSRGKLWSDAETNSLIEAWGDEVIQQALENAKTPKQSNKVYKTLIVSFVIKFTNLPRPNMLLIIQIPISFRF